MLLWWCSDASELEQICQVTRLSLPSLLLSFTFGSCAVDPPRLRRGLSVRSLWKGCLGALGAQKGLDAHCTWGTWALESVRELSDWMCEPSIPDDVFGRACPITGVKHSEISKNNWESRAQGVSFQGNNVRTKSGRAPCDVFEEISNALAFITAAQCASRRP